MIQFIAILIVAALWANWGWVLIALCVGAYIVHRLVKEIRRARADAEAAAAAEAERLEGLRARADQQYTWRMQGDPRGTYGEFPPATT
jgi:hypothetical protein